MKNQLILDGEGQVTFTLEENGEMKIETFDQRLFVDTFDKRDRLKLLWWLVRGFLNI